MTEVFQRVSNNAEKGLAYQQQIEQFNLAKSQGFYFECIFILYALLEDRLTSFFYHAGLTGQNRQKLTPNKAVRTAIADIFPLEEMERRRFQNISTRIRLFQNILTWSRSYPLKDSTDEYCALLCKQLEATPKTGEMLVMLNQLDQWRGARNQLVHALLNKDPMGMKIKLQGLVEEGEAYWRELDQFIKQFRHKNHIRKRFNIQ